MNKETELITIKNQIATIKATIATEKCDYKIQYERLYKLEQQLKEMENNQ